MRKYVSMIAVMFFITGFCMAAHAAVDKTFEVSVLATVGDVQVDVKGDGNWTKAVPGMKLATGAKIKTGAASKVNIVYDAEGLNIVEIKENTMAMVKASSLDLVQGSVLAKFDNLEKGSSFTVNTPNAACAIRGSGMGVDYIRNMTVLWAFNGTAFVVGRDSSGQTVFKEVAIPEGWKTSVGVDGMPVAPENLSANEWLVWNEWQMWIRDSMGPALRINLTGLVDQANNVQTDLDPGDIDETKKDNNQGGTVISPAS